MTIGEMKAKQTRSRRRYKNRDLYVCLTLNKLVSALDVDIHQTGLEDNLDLLVYNQDGLPKNVISKEIRTNYVQTRKILNFLIGKKFITMESNERSHTIKITKQGILFIRKSNFYFAQTYSDTIEEHFQFKGLPAWYRAEQGFVSANA